MSDETAKQFEKDKSVKESAPEGRSVTITITLHPIY